MDSNWENEVLYTGYIEKSGGSFWTTWKRRYFVLKADRSFEYFTSPEKSGGSKKGCGSFPAHVQHTFVQQQEIVEFPGLDEDGSERTWRFKFENETEKQYWCEFASNPSMAKTYEEFIMPTYVENVEEIGRRYALSVCQMKFFVLLRMFISDEHIVSEICSYLSVIPAHDKTIDTKSEISCISLSKWDSYVIVGCADGTLQMYDTESLNLIRILEGHTGRINCFCISSDDEYMLSASNDCTMRYWNVTTGVCQGKMSGHTAEVLCCDLASDNSFILSGGADGALNLTDLKSGNLIKKIEEDGEHPINCCQIAQDISFFVTGSSALLTVWTSSGEIIRKVPILYFNCVHISPQNNLISVGTYLDVRILKKDSKKAWKIFGKQTYNGVNDLELSYDEQYIVVACGDGITKLYHIPSDEEIVYESTNKEEKITAVSIAKDASFFVHAFGSKFTFANTKVTERFISCWDGLQRNFSVAVTPSPKDCLRSHEDKF